MTKNRSVSGLNPAPFSYLKIQEVEKIHQELLTILIGS